MAKPAGLFAARVLISMLVLALLANTIVAQAATEGAQPYVSTATSQMSPGSLNRTSADTSAIDKILGKLPVGSQVIHDPTGYYEYIYHAPREFTINLTGYDKARADPHSHVIGKATVQGETVYIVVPESNTSANSIALTSSNWAGVGGGFCQSVSQSGGGGSLCNNPSDTIQENVAQTDVTMGWNKACIPSSYTACESAFWGGMSQADTSSGYLVQNGFNGGWSSTLGVNTLQAWYEIYCSSGCQNEQTFTQQPTSGWQNQTEEFITKVITSGCPSSCTNTAYFYDYIGTGGAVYSASTTEPSPASQSSFMQGEGIMEAPTLNGFQTCQLTSWSPNPLTMRGYYWGPDGLLNYYSNGSYWTNSLQSYCSSQIIAYGSQQSGSSTFTITHN